MAWYNASKINPATGRPHRDDKAIGADRKGRAKAKAEHEAWVKKAREEQARLVKQSKQAKQRASARWN